MEADDKFINGILAELSTKNKNGYIPASRDELGAETLSRHIRFYEFEKGAKHLFISEARRMLKDLEKNEFSYEDVRSSLQEVNVNDEPGVKKVSLPFAGNYPLYEPYYKLGIALLITYKNKPSKFKGLFSSAASKEEVKKVWNSQLESVLKLVFLVVDKMKEKVGAGASFEQLWKMTTERIYSLFTQRTEELINGLGTYQNPWSSNIDTPADRLIQRFHIIYRNEPVIYWTKANLSAMLSLLGKIENLEAKYTTKNSSGGARKKMRRRASRKASSHRSHATRKIKGIHRK